MRLFRTLLLLMLVVGVVPIVLVGWFALSETRRMLVHESENLARERVKQLSLRISATVQGGLLATHSLVATPKLMGLPEAEQQFHLRAALHRPPLKSITVLDRHGQKLPALQVAAEDVLPEELEAHENWAKQLFARPGGVRLSEIHVRGPGKAPSITAITPVGNPPRAYVASELSLGEVARQLEQDRLKNEEGVLVVDAEGRLIASSGKYKDGPLELGTSLGAHPSVKELLALDEDARKADTVRLGTFGDGAARVVAAYTLVPDLGWAVIYEQPVEAAYRQVAQMEQRFGWTLLGAFSVALLIAALFARQVTRPLKGFISGAMELAQGKFGVQVEVKQKNELGELAQTFNYMSQQMLASTTEMQGLYDSLEKGYLETIVALANSIDSKDAYTRGHSQRVGDLSVEIGTEMGLTRRELRLLHYGGILHDIGKIGIVDAILCKQSRLTDEEMLVMRDHPVIGGNIVQAVTFLAPVRAAVRNHHEKWDGTGYPDGLKGEEIPLIARIVNCADTFDACTSTRPYQKAMPLDKAMEILERLRGTQLDPAVLDALRSVLQKKGVRLEGSRQPVKLAS